MVLLWSDFVRVLHGIEVQQCRSRLVQFERTNVFLELAAGWVLPHTAGRQKRTTAVLSRIRWRNHANADETGRRDDHLGCERVGRKAELRCAPAKESDE